MRSRMYQPVRAEPTLTQRIGGYIVFVVLGATVIYVVTEILKLICKPIGWIFASSEELEQGSRALESKRLMARAKARAQYAQDEQDQMNQYISRFVDEPTGHVGDPDNDKYQKWYESWSAGKVIDTELRWAPEVYEEVEDDERRISPRFCSYLKTQIELHESAGFLARARLLATIRNFYPEFTPQYGTLKTELGQLHKRDTVTVRRADLQAKLGIPESVAVALDGLALSPEQLRERVALAKRYVGKGYDEETVGFLAVNGVTNDNTAELAKRLVSYRISPEVALDYQEGRLSMPEILDVVNSLSSLTDAFGEAVYATGVTGKSRLEEAAEIKVAEVKMAHKRRLREGAWRH